MPPKKRLRRTTHIAEEQAQSVEKTPEFDRVGLSGTVRILLDEALAARKGEPIAFSLLALRQQMETQSDKEIISIIKLGSEILEQRVKGIS